MENYQMVHNPAAFYPSSHDYAQQQPDQPALHSTDAAVPAAAGPSTPAALQQRLIELQDLIADIKQQQLVVQQLAATPPRLEAPHQQLEARLPDTAQGMLLHAPNAWHGADLEANLSPECYSGRIKPAPSTAPRAPLQKLVLAPQTQPPAPPSWSHQSYCQGAPATHPDCMQQDAVALIRIEVSRLLALRNKLTAAHAAAVPNSKVAAACEEAAVKHERAMRQALEALHSVTGVAAVCNQGTAALAGQGSLEMADGELVPCWSGETGSINHTFGSKGDGGDDDGVISSSEGDVLDRSTLSAVRCALNSSNVRDAGGTDLAGAAASGDAALEALMPPLGALCRHSTAASSMCSAGTEQATLGGADIRSVQGVRPCQRQVRAGTSSMPGGLDRAVAYGSNQLNLLHHQQQHSADAALPFQAADFNDARAAQLQALAQMQTHLTTMHKELSRLQVQAAALHNADTKQA